MLVGGILFLKILSLRMDAPKIVTAILWMISDQFYNSILRQMINKKLATWVLVVMLVSCAAPKALEYKTFHDFSIQKLGFNNSTVKMELEYYNPNNFGMQLRNSDLDIFIDGTLLGHSSFDTLINIPRRNTFLLPIKFDVDMQNLYKNAWSTLIGKEVMVKLTGKLKVGKANVFMSLPVNYETKETFSMF